MDVFFMSVWDDARQGTKYYICYGEDTPRGYHTDTLPILWLPDSVAVESEASRIVGELWHESNTYFLSFEPGDGKHFFAPVRRVFELLGELKRFTAESLRNSPVRTLGQIRRTGEDSWVMSGGGGAVAGVDIGNGQMAFDMETLGQPFAGGGGAAAPLPSNNGNSLGRNTPDGAWRSLSARQRASMTMTERVYDARTRMVNVTFADGQHYSYTEQQYNVMVDDGTIVGFERI